jgi:ABC-2 type transport system permease protein
MLTLVRREFWENRALWAAPLIVGAILLVGAIFGRVEFGLPLNIVGDQKRSLFGIITWGLTLPYFITMAIVLYFYLLDSLYSERRDRSILFWKSLPVSDAETVLSKFLVATLIVPLGVFLLSLLTNLLVLAIFGIRGSGVTAGNPIVLWDARIWFGVQGFILFSVLVAALWYAPIAAYLMAVSAWAKRSVFIWAALPPILLIMVERYVLGTERVLEFLRDRLVGFATLLTASGSKGSFNITIGEGAGHDRIPNVQKLFDSFDAARFVTDPGLWLGLLAAAALLYAAIRMRRYRDDT